MRRFLSSRLTIVVAVLAILTLITGVTWAANSPAPASQEVKTSVVEVMAMPVPVPVGGKLDVLGAGFDPDEVVLFQVVLGGGSPNVFLPSGFANSAGAFLSTEESLPAILTPGFYTITAKTLVDGKAAHVASAPLWVCATSEGKCVSS